MPAVMGIPKFDVTIDPSDYAIDLSEVIKKIKPDIDRDNLKYTVYHGGLTNKLIGCYDTSAPEHIILCRIYGDGTENFIDRDNEVKNMIFLNECHIGSKVYCKFNNGICYEYIQGKIVDCDLLKQQSVYSKVAKLTAKLHKLRPNDNDSQKNKLVIFEKIYDLFNLMPIDFNQTTLKSTLTNIQMLPSFDKIKYEIDFMIDFLRKHATANNSRIVFSHNDILLGNVIYDEKLNRISFIDFEYSGMNYQAFDIGNHFNEYAGTENIDYNHYPNKEYQLDWLKTYLLEYFSTNVELVGDELVENFYKEVNKFALLSHLFWGVWAIVQAKNMESDFDYVVFALSRFNEYFKKKDEFLNL